MSALQIFKEDAEETFNIGADPDEIVPEIIELVAHAHAHATVACL